MAGMLLPFVMDALAILKLQSGIGRPVNHRLCERIPETVHQTQRVSSSSGYSGTRRCR